jgi:endonuclease/exonuclease/phosphatase family metal-dependent hydrolase
MLPQAPVYGSTMTTLRIATFNIRHGLGTDGKVDIARTARVISQLDPDVISLQELDRNLERSGGVDQPARLAELTGLRVHFSPAIGWGGGEYGIALGFKASLGAMPEVASFALPRVDDEEDRIALVAELSGLTILGAHLSTRPGPRDVQMMALRRHLEARSKPIVVAGDLNAPRRHLLHLKDAGLVPGPRTPTMSFWRQVDHILTSPDVNVSEHRTLSTDASDHRPLVATISF